MWWGAADGRVETFRQAGEAAGYQVFRPAARSPADRARRSRRRAVCCVGASVKQVRGGRRGRDCRTSSSSTTGARAHRRLASCSIARDAPASSRARDSAVTSQATAPRRSSASGMLSICVPAGWNLPDDTHTLVETYEDGWAWSVPLSATLRQVGVAWVDGGTTRIQRGPTLAPDLPRGVRKNTRAQHADVGRATLVYVMCGQCDAPLPLGAPVCRCFPEFLLVGDAGVVHRSAVVVRGQEGAGLGLGRRDRCPHLSLRYPDRQRCSRSSFSRTGSGRFTPRNLQRTRDFARHAHAHHPSAFWAARAAAVAASAPTSDEMTDDDD